MAASTKDQLLRELAKLSARGGASPNTESARKARVAAIRSELSSKHGLPEDKQDDAALELADPKFAKKPADAKTEQPKSDTSMAEPAKTGASGSLYGNLNGWLYNAVAEQVAQQEQEQPAQPDAALDNEKKQAKDRLDKLKADKAALDQQPQPAPPAQAPAAAAPAQPAPEQIDRSELPGFSKRDEQMFRRATQLFKQSQKGGSPQSLVEIYNGLTKGSRIFGGSANERGDISWAPKEVQDFIQSKYNTDWAGKDKHGLTNDTDWADQFKFRNRAEPDYAKFENPDNGQQWRAANGNFEVNVPNEHGQDRWVQQPAPSFVNQLPQEKQDVIFPVENSGWGKLQQHFGNDWNQKPNEPARDWHMRQVQMLTGNPNGDTYRSGVQNGQPFNAVLSQKYGGGGFATNPFNTQPSVPAVTPSVANPPVPDVDAALSVPPPKTA